MNLNKQLIVISVALVFLAIAPFVKAGGVLSKIKADMQVSQVGDNNATAINTSGSYNTVKAKAGIGHISITSISSQNDLQTDVWIQLNVLQTGSNTAYANNKSGMHNNITATAGISMIEIIN